MAASLRLTTVRIRIHGRELVALSELVVGADEAVTIMGPSGSGKSTLLAFVCGAIDPEFEAEGRVFIGAEDVSALPAHRRRFGILFQDDLLFPHLSVAENLAFGLREDVRTRAERRRRIAEALDEAELGGYGDRDPATLSGGQRARVALLRTLLAQPRALLLDEPFSKLDVALRERFRSFVFAHARRRQLPVLLVTHDAADAQAAGGRVIELNSPSE